MASRECLDNSEAKKERRNESSKRRKTEFQDGMHKTAFPDTRGVHRLKVEEWRHARPSMLTWCGRTITDGQENRCKAELQLAALSILASLAKGKHSMNL